MSKHDNAQQKINAFLAIELGPEKYSLGPQMVLPTYSARTSFFVVNCKKLPVTILLRKVSYLKET